MNEYDMMDFVRTFQSEDYEFICLKEGLDGHPKLSVKELAFRYNISERQVYRWADKIFKKIKEEFTCQI